MAQSVRAPVETRSRRLRLEARKRPYWVVVEKGLAVGYHRPVGGGAGTWWVRAAVPGKVGYPYKEAALAHADDYSDADGCSTLDWKRAQAAARSWAPKQVNSGPLTVMKAFERYLLDLRARKGVRAAKETAGKIDKHIKATLGAKLVSDLTADDVRGWHGGMVRGDNDDARRRSRDSANRVLSILKAALNLAFQDGAVGDDRAWRRVGAFKGVGEARKVILGPAELQRLIDACPDRLRELVAAGAWTGARLGELTTAQVRDLDANAATLRVRGKTGSREVHLSLDALALCRRMANAKQPDNALFTTTDSGPWTESLHKRPFAAAVVRAEIDPDTTFYALRHAYISHALKVGVPAKAVADHCGTSLRMIEANYAKFMPEDRARYAALAAPALRLAADDQKVTPLRRASSIG
jgi:integrase